MMQNQECLLTHLSTTLPCAIPVTLRAHLVLQRAYPSDHNGAPGAVSIRRFNGLKSSTLRPKISRRRRTQCPFASNNGGTKNTQIARSASDKKVARLKSWLKKLGHDDCNLKVERCSNGAGYGAFAGPGGVAKGSVVVRVPKKAFMTGETAAKCPDIGPLVEKAKLTVWQALCLHLLCERARGTLSFWDPYISILPPEFEMAEAHPLLWPQEMRKEWLEGSPMLDVIERRLAICREDHKAMLAAGAHKLAPAGPGSDGFVTEAAVRWAAAILLSRSFSLDIEDEESEDYTGETIALVPWADMLNHSSLAGKESCLAHNQTSGVASLRAHQRYGEGVQVYDSYGPGLSPSNLLLDYGFVDLENINHAVDLPASILGPLKSKSNQLLLEAVGLPIDGAVFSLTPAGVDESVLAWTRAAIASHQELIKAGWKEGAASRKNVYFDASRAMALFSAPISGENETAICYTVGEQKSKFVHTPLSLGVAADEADGLLLVNDTTKSTTTYCVLRRLLGACENLCKKYLTTLEQDEKTLADSTGDDAKVNSWARLHSKRALRSEKLALKEARRTLLETLKIVGSGVSI